MLARSVIAPVAMAAASTINLLALLLWVRWLGPGEYGILALAGAAGLLINAVAFEWLRLAGARTLLAPESPHKVQPPALAALVRANAGAAAFLVLLAMIATATGLSAPGLPAHWNSAIVMIAIAEMMFGTVLLVARMRLRTWTFGFLLIARSLLVLLGGTLAVLAGFGIPGLVAAMVLAPLIVAVVAIVADQSWRGALAGSQVDTRALLRLGAPLILASTVALASTLADRVLAGALIGSAAAGAIAAPSDLVAKTLGFAMMALNVSAYPLLVRHHDAGDPVAAARALRRNGFALLVVGAPIAAASALFATPLCAILLGPGYPDADRLMPWLAGAALLRSIATFHYGVAFQLERRMAWLVPGPLLSLSILAGGAPWAIAVAGLEGLVQLGFAAQAAGLALSALLARHGSRAITSRCAPTTPPSAIATRPSSVAPQ